MKNITSGRLYWLTGLAGAGKTTIADKLANLIRSRRDKVIHLDGDKLRELMGVDQRGYDIESRRQLSKRYAILCNMLVVQGVDVVCSTISLFQEVHEFNRKYNEKYFEVLIDASMDTLNKRDKKGLYSTGSLKETGEVIGVTLDLEFPQDPHLVVKNNGDNLTEELAMQILESADNHFSKCDK